MPAEMTTRMPIDWRDYVELCKPRVVLLMLLTVVVGMYLATPGWVDLSLLASSLIGIGFCGGSAATINHLVDRHIDSIMARTQKRPVARGRVSVVHGLRFAIILGVSGLVILSIFVNILTALLSFLNLNWLCGYLYWLFKTCNFTKYCYRRFSRCRSTFIRLDCCD